MPLRLYDLCGADDLRFSPYCTRAKMALALKGLAYETVPVPFTSISAIADGSYKTVPVLEDGDRRVVDSFAIAQYLDETYPDRPLFAPGPAGIAAARFVEGSLFASLHAGAMRLVAKPIHDRLLPVDQTYFRTSREARLGRTLEEAYAGHEADLAAFRKLLAPLRHTLGHAPWFGGDAPLFVDAIVYGSLYWLHTVSDADWLDGEPLIADWYGRAGAIATPAG
ncbi:glutathione S-transferase N-terminal domain-containing protein [Mongoliimonas terrestris]|uniref:glutathione S-transferase N-terminal domain-containing protein n=1 Tax=Mongoliimonas terrestris TaxID=1709001 RepID=UPI0009496EA4|nr:glutathione S-transferase N-terminal domain-containing protein [Mongoliimonas terrestris]